MKRPPKFILTSGKHIAAEGRCIIMGKAGGRNRNGVIYGCSSYSLVKYVRNFVLLFEQ